MNTLKWVCLAAILGLVGGLLVGFPITKAADQLRTVSAQTEKVASSTFSTKKHAKPKSAKSYSSKKTKPFGKSKKPKSKSKKHRKST